MKKFIIINGTFCGGKSTAIQSFAIQKKFFLISFDGLKKFFSQYDRKINRGYVESLMLVLLRDSIKFNMDVVCEGVLIQDLRMKIIKEAKNLGYQVFEFNIEADIEITLERFRKRKSEKKEKDIYNLEENSSEVRFIEKFKYYQNTKNPKATTFNSSKMSAEQIASKIIAEVY